MVSGEGRGRGQGRRVRRRGACDGGGRGGRAGKTTTTGALAAVGAYLANDLRDPEGLARPVLRRAAQTLAASRRAALRKAGTGYLKLDPPRTTLLEQTTAERRDTADEVVEAEFVEIVEPEGERR